MSRYANEAAKRDSTMEDDEEAVRELRKLMTLRTTADWQKMARKMRKIGVKYNMVTASPSKLLSDGIYEPSQFIIQLQRAQGIL
jgi:hypothetical protein